MWAAVALAGDDDPPLGVDGRGVAEITGGPDRRRDRAARAEARVEVALGCVSHRGERESRDDREDPSFDTRPLPDGMTLLDPAADLAAGTVMSGG